MIMIKQVKVKVGTKAKLVRLESIVKPVIEAAFGMLTELGIAVTFLHLLLFGRDDGSSHKIAPKRHEETTLKMAT